MLRPTDKHYTKLRSANPLKQVNKEISRRRRTQQRRTAGAHECFRSRPRSCVTRAFGDVWRPRRVQLRGRHVRNSDRQARSPPRIALTMKAARRRPSRLLRHVRASGGWLLLPREAIVGTGRAVGGVAGAHHALPHACALQGKAGAGVHHRRTPGMDGGDDLLRGDSLQVGAGRGQVRVSQLALDQRQRDPLT